MIYFYYLAVGWPLLAVMTAIVIGRLEFRVKKAETKQGVFIA